jgi:hypothetical protein
MRDNVPNEDFRVSSPSGKMVSSLVPNVSLPHARRSSFTGL